MPEINGTPGDDSLIGNGNAAHTINGLGGNDTLDGGNGADLLVGGADNDRLIGGADTNADTLDGGAGNDTLAGGPGGDSLAGGAGNDFADYSGSAAVTGVQVDLTNNFNNVGGDANGDFLSGIEGVIGSAFFDRLTGDGNANTLDGGADNDTLIGAGGADLLLGGTGNDQLQGGLDGDTAAGGLGDDRIFGDEGADCLIGGEGGDSIRGGTDADTVEGEAGEDQLSGQEGNDVLLGGDGNDQLFGQDDADSLVGGAGNDTLDGEAGDDTMAGGAGADQLQGSDGTDVLDYSASAAPVSVNLTTGAASGGDAEGDILALAFTKLEGAIGTAGADTLVGNPLDNTLEGGDGNDDLTGGAGADRLDGGAGLADTARYSGAGVRIDLGAGTASGGDAEGDTLTGIENLVGTGSADTLGGDGGANTLDGGAGNDLLRGGDGADSLLGGADGDTIAGNAGNDTVFAGEGDDFVVAAKDGSNDSLTGGGGNDTLFLQGWTGPNDFGALANGTYGEWQVLNGVFANLQDGTVVKASGFESLVCFAAGTRILTAEGEVPVEALRPGTMVATLSGVGAPLKPVLWVGRRRVVLAGNPAAAALSPIRIRAGALAEATPTRDLLVSPDHCLFLDGALVPARLLVNGTSIVVERGLAEVTYYHVELDRHDVLLAEGAAAESWLDAGNRHWFENARVALLQVADAPDAYATEAATPCAEVLQGGPRLALIRDAIALRERRLETRAGAPAQRHGRTQA